jgi:hypothetical protein
MTQEEKEKRTIEFLETAHESGMIWLILSSLISSDSCIDIESCEKNLELSQDFSRVIDRCLKIPEKDRKTYAEYLENGRENIIKRDLEEFKKQKEGN